jgi:hypothetical protein
MTKLSDLGEPIFGEQLFNAIDESEYFYQCQHCGQMVDRRDPWQLMWHVEPDHDPLEMDA